MARPLREGSLGEPPAPLPAHPACRGGGGSVGPACTSCLQGREGGGRWSCVGIPPPLTPPPRRHPRLSCACPGAPPPNFVLYRCGTRGTPGAAHGEFHPTEDGDHEGPPQSGGSRGGAVPNGHLPGAAPGPEQELGARLRRLGDAFQRTYEQQQREQRGGIGGVFWGHLYRLVSQLLGAVYNLQAAALPAREAN
ncbi:splicing factor, proline- and glutamine-rich-like isoform X1 [Accipiter gentilis]|uniref:splicing factor, proline- and glutamine-rich-like isoform X1 n=1 Tax=Astur gentilis TaxID=8957 RepID=UPI002110D845|nr:splicing factor, proline- and glutamine-rich-like isoform X1 [Accipiter gentilis]